MLKKNKLKIILIILSIILLILISFIVYKLTIEKNKKEIKEEKKDYVLKIQYPEIEDKEVENKIKKYVDNLKEQVKKESKEKDLKEKYELDVTNEIVDYTNVKNVIVKTKISKENETKEEDKIYKYEENTKEIISFKSYFNEKTNYLKVLKEESEKLITQEIEKNKYNINKEEIKKTLEDEENFDNSYFDDKGMNIIFNLKGITIKITINYDKLKEVLNYEHIDSSLKESLNTINDLKKKKLIAFTFDDGPSQYTEKLLKELEKRDAKVTFFIVGNRVKYYETSVKKAYEMGNQICSHSYSHKRLTDLDDKEFKRQIKKSIEEIKRVTNYEVNCLRPPYGVMDAKTLKKTNLINILWNVDTLDWKYRDKNKVKKKIIESAKDGSIILLHDLYETSIDGMLQAMDELKNKGYAFVTIDEMAKIRGVKLEKNKKYSSIK